MFVVVGKYNLIPSRRFVLRDDNSKALLQPTCIYTTISTIQAQIVIAILVMEHLLLINELSLCC